jgi:hypothetical protein
VGIWELFWDWPEVLEGLSHLGDVSLDDLLNAFLEQYRKPGGTGRALFDIATMPFLVGKVKDAEEVAELGRVARIAEKAAEVAELLEQVSKDLEIAQKAGESAQVIAAMKRVEKVRAALKDIYWGEFLRDAEKIVRDGGKVGDALGKPGFLRNLRDFWKISGGVTEQEAAAIAKAEGFGFEVGRVSRFENARNAVVIAKGDLEKGLVNRLELAEEIQHGLDRASNAAGRAIRRGLSNEEFHAEVFERIVARYKAGGYQFLTADDIKALEKLIQELR